jgi:hypothetical protein
MVANGVVVVLNKLVHLLIVGVLHIDNLLGVKIKWYPFKSEIVNHSAKVIDYSKLQLFSLSARLAEPKSLEKAKPPSNFVVRNNSTRQNSS